MYSGIVKGKAKNEIERELRHLKKNSALTQLTIGTLRRLQDTTPVGLISLLFTSAYFYKSNLIVNKILRDGLVEEKTNLIKEMSSDTSKPFFMASMHDDSATDHVAYQGKLYIDENATGEALEYAKAHSLHTLQWVIGDPAWFVTRPYCRHYFVQYSLDEVKKGVKPLHTAIGVRLTKGNAGVYSDRLDMLKALYRIKPEPLLKNKIDRTRFLLAKWKGEEI